MTEGREGLVGSIKRDDEDEIDDEENDEEKEEAIEKLKAELYNLSPEEARQRFGRIKPLHDKVNQFRFYSRKP